MNRRICLLAALALSACATAPPPVVSRSPATYSELEPIYRVDASRDALLIVVGSNGCTAKADFNVSLERTDGALSLAFGRKRIDPCKSFAAGRVELRYTWLELGVPPGTQVFLLNPLLPWTGPGS